MSWSLTELERKILGFFHEHPHAVESLRGIGTWLGDGDAAGVEAAVKSLAARRWLATHEAAAVTAYSLTREERLLGQIREALKGPGCGGR